MRPPILTALVFLGLGLGCAADDAVTPVPVFQTASPVTAPPPPPPLAATVSAVWIDLEHVAGRGEVSDEGVNSWKKAFEGKPAVDAELSRPYFAVADASGRIYVADKEAHAIRRIERDGTIHTHAGTGIAGDDGDEPGPASKLRLAHPNGLFVQPDGVLFVLDLDNGKIRRIAADGVMTTVVTTGGPIDTGRGLWMSPDGTVALWAEKTRVRRWRQRGRTDTLAEGFVSVGNLGWDEASNGLFVCDRGGDRVFRVQPTGTQDHFAGGPSSAPLVTSGRANEVFLDGPRSIVVLPEGGFVIATHESAQIWTVAPDGTARLLIGRVPGFVSPVDLGGKTLSAIRGMSLTPEGDLLLVHGDGGFVHRLRRQR